MLKLFLIDLYNCLFQRDLKLKNECLLCRKHDYRAFRIWVSSSLIITKYHLLNLKQIIYRYGNVAKAIKHIEIYD